MPPTKILLFGGTGPTGILTIQRALDQGCEIIAYVRSPDRLPDDIKNDARVTVVEGTLTDRDQITHALSLSPTVIVSLLGPSAHEMTAWLSAPSTWSSTIFVDFYRLLVELIKSSSSPCRRIYAMGTVSIYGPKDAPSVSRWFMASSIWLLAHGAWNNMIGIGKCFSEEVKEGEGIEWTVFRLGGLYDYKDGEEVGVVTAGNVGDVGDTGWVKRGDVANWLVEQAKKEDNGNWRWEMPYLWTAGKTISSSGLP